MERLATALEIERALVHLLPEPPDLQGVLAEKEGAQARANLVRGWRIDDRLGNRGRGIDLSQAGDAFIGMDAHDDTVLAAVADGCVDRPPGPQQNRFNLGNAH